jgi:hypothetical protein
MKMVPYVVGAMVVFMIAFALFVRSVPPKTIPKPILQQQQARGGVPDFMNVDTKPSVKQGMEEALKETAEVVPEEEPIKAAAF